MPYVVKFPRDMISTLSLGSLGETSTSPCIDLHRDVDRAVDASQSHIELMVQEPDFAEGVAACTENSPAMANG